jgi:CheY-like chemotaxis protein
MDAYVSKPIQPRQLMEAIAGVVAPALETPESAPAAS